MTEEKKLTGVPSIDKPWLKYYSEEAINAPLPQSSLYDYLYECNREHMEDYALNYFGKKTTFREFFELIEQAAKAFRAIGVHEGDIVPIVSVSTVASIICFYALNRIGAVVDFLNVLAEQKDLVEYFKEADAKLVVTLDLFEEKVLAASDKCDIEKVVSFGVDYGMPLPLKVGYKLKNKSRKPKNKGLSCIIEWNNFLRKSKSQPDINYRKDPHKMCLLAHTGGTTGESKIVMIDDCAVNAVACQQYSIYRRLSEFEKNSTFLQVMIPFVVYGISTCTHMPLSMGWCLGVVPKFDGKNWSKYLKQYGFSHAFAVPAYVTCMLDDPRLSQADLSIIKTIAVGGDGITETLENEVNRFLAEHGSKSELYKGYGMTEICAAGLISFPTCNRIGSVGVPLPKNNIMIYDNEQEAELPYHEIGEICLQSPSRMIGYMNNEQATRELFRIHADGSEWLHTGDLGYIDEDGFLFLVGRMKRVILTAKDGVTYKVFPNMTEKVLDENESVIQSCVVGAESGADQVLRAFVVVSKEDMSRIAEIETSLRNRCEEKLPSYARPTFYEFKESFPLTAAGKIDYRTLESEHK